MNQQNNIDLIEQYLSNELSDAERKELEAQLETDKDLANELDRRQTAHQMIDFMISESLRNQLKALEAEDSKVVSLASRTRRLYTLAIAASVIILIGAFFFLIPGGQSLSNQQLAMNYYEAPVFTMRSSGDETIEANLAAGLQALRDTDYRAAIQNLEQISPENDQYIMARYYLGHAHFLAREYTAAGNYFAEVINSNDIRYIEDAQWYALLSCLSQDQTCQEMLDRILNDQNHLHYRQAQELKNAQTK